MCGEAKWCPACYPEIIELYGSVKSAWKILLVLQGSWDLVAKVINKVVTLKIRHNASYLLLNAMNG